MIIRKPFKTPTLLLKNAPLTKIACLTLGLVSASISASHAQEVALLDGPVSSDSGLNLDDGFNFYTNSEDTDDTSMSVFDSHGTVVARIAAEAYSGGIVPLVITDGDLTGADEGLVRSARNAALESLLTRSTVSVVGITWNTSGVVDTSSPLISQLSAAGKVVAILAGDDSAAQPNALALSSFNNLGVVIVGATDADGEILPDSNRAGSAAAKYVAISGLPTPGALTGDTSFATARLAGIAGAVLLQNPNLTAAQVIDVILQSAEDRGDTGTDDVYGRGVILNAQQVLNNVIGDVTVPTTPGTPVTPVDPSTDSVGGGGGGGAAVILLGGALAGALMLRKKPSDKLEKTLVLDSYGRSFETDLNKQIEINDGSLHLNQFFHSLKQQTNGHSFASQIEVPRLRTQVTFQVAELIDPRIDFIEYFATPGDVGIEPRQSTAAFAVNSALSDSVSFAAAYNVSADQEFGAGKKLTSNGQFGSSSFLSGQSFGSVLSGFSTQANTSSLAYKPSKNGKVSMKLGLVSVDETERFNQQSLSTLFEGEYKFDDNAGISLQFGQIEEEGSVLGGGGGGIFGVEGATTYAINLGGNLKLGKKFALVGNYGIGRTSVESSNNSLLKDFSNIRSNWYSLGLVGNNVWRAKDQFGLAFAQPLKVQAGEVDYSIPFGRLSNGNIAFDTERVNLADTDATEHTMDVYYRTMVTDKFEVGAFMSYRQNPNHVSDHGDDAMVMATVRFWQ
jgi:hypothetical protein